MNPLKFVNIAQAMADLSKDPRTKVGAVVIDDDGNILATGYNGFPRGVNDDPERYANREVKIKLISHAESNAIAQAARNGIRLYGSTLILTSLYPCTNCAKQIIQAGIRRVYAPKMSDGHSPEWYREKEISELMFSESAVEIVEWEFVNEKPTR